MRRSDVRPPPSHIPVSSSGQAFDPGPPYRIYQRRGPVTLGTYSCLRYSLAGMERVGWGHLDSPRRKLRCPAHRGCPPRAQVNPSWAYCSGCWSFWRFTTILTPRSRYDITSSLALCIRSYVNVILAASGRSRCQAPDRQATIAFLSSRVAWAFSVLGVPSAGCLGCST